MDTCTHPGDVHFFLRDRQNVHRRRYRRNNALERCANLVYGAPRTYRNADNLVFTGLAVYLVENPLKKGNFPSICVDPCSICGLGSALRGIRKSTTYSEGKPNKSSKFPGKDTKTRVVAHFPEKILLRHVYEFVFFGKSYSVTCRSRFFWGKDAPSRDKVKFFRENLLRHVFD